MHGDPDLHEIVEWLNLYLEEYSRHPVPAQFKISFLKRSYCAWRLQNLDDTNNKNLNPQICAQIQILDFMNNKLDLTIPGNTEHVEKITTTVEETQPYQATLDQFNKVFNNLESDNETFELFLNTVSISFSSATKRFPVDEPAKSFIPQQPSKFFRSASSLALSAVAPK